MSNLTQQEIKLLQRAINRDVTVLQDPNVSKVKNEEGYTPLHYAAMYFEEAVNHPDSSKVKNKWGNTPLHHAAERFEAAIYHPDFDKVKNNYGDTPKDLYQRRHGALIHVSNAKLSDNDFETVSLRLPTNLIKLLNSAAEEAKISPSAFISVLLIQNCKK